jgi:prevent-host-death family protein
MLIAVREAKNHLGKYGRLAHDGATVVVTKNGQPWFDLVPHRQGGRKTTPLPEVKPTITLQEAIAPLDEADAPGWI